MHMVMGAVSAFLHQAMTGKVPFEMRIHGDGQARLPAAHTRIMRRLAPRQEKTRLRMRPRYMWRLELSECLSLDGPLLLRSVAQSRQEQWEDRRPPCFTCSRW